MVISKKKMPEIQIKVEPISGIKKKRVGILGGTFNPIHHGHLIMAEQVKSQLDLDKVMFMPDNLPPHVDAKSAIDAKYRLKMAELAIETNPDFEIEDIELKRGGVSYTYDTMKELTLRNPETEYYFIIGGDMVEDCRFDQTGQICRRRTSRLQAQKRVSDRLGGRSAH